MELIISFNTIRFLLMLQADNKRVSDHADIASGPEYRKVEERGLIP
jgi:hypothetical protein